MTIKMLIDATHEEETRVTVVHGNRVEEFDYESSAKKQIKGNIYLAKVTRVEPSLQAAFVEYGGNRHGFLAFSEIHPDYYQIPVSDREALIAEESAAYAALHEQEEELIEKKPKRKARRRKKKPELADQADQTTSETDNEAEATKVAETEKPESESPETETPGEDSSPEDSSPADDTDDDNSPSETKAELVTESDSVSEEVSPEDEDISDTEEDSDNDETDEDENDEIETTGSQVIDDEEAEERLRIRIAKSLRRKYKIQEVIKKNQILLIQVVKEERGNKGAALTTYMSLPGRYCVLMPNTLHGGGVSRKIANTSDRKSLKNILSGLEIPGGMACIIRTAGQSRTKSEIKRDFDYMISTWQVIRERTLKSVAPVLIHEEGDLIKRSIRDLYTREIDEILVEGEKGYKTARTFMKLLMPSHARKIKHYTEPTPLFHRYQVEGQLDSMYSPIVQLKSGGYIVINPTEALVSIDVNSGRSTKEHNIEETAKKTNLEAAEEIARQLRLRDMAGLIVIDFIDMEIRGNNRTVEQKMKECLKGDRARIQVGRISSFGLMEMSRQRLRAGVLESSTRTCPHCEGAGVIRSVESQVLHIFRALEEEGIRARNEKIAIKLPQKVAIYLLNNKRARLVEIEKQYNFTIEVILDPSLTETGYEIEQAGSDNKDAEKKPSSHGKKADQTPRRNDRHQGKRDDDRSGSSRQNRQRNQSRKRRERDREKDTSTESLNEPTENTPVANQVTNDEKGTAENKAENRDNKPRRRRRRPRRGNKNQETDNAVNTEGTENASANVASEAEATSSPDQSETPAQPKRRGRGRTPKKTDKKATQPEVKPAENTDTSSEQPDVKSKKPSSRRSYPPQARSRRRPTPADKSSDSKSDEKAAPEKAEKPVESPPAEPKKTEPKKTGWWSRTFG